METKNSGIIHDWIYVVTPAEIAGKTSPLFAAFCKQCRCYYSEAVPFDARSGKKMITVSGLPKYDCVPTDGVRT